MTGTDKVKTALWSLGCFCIIAAGITAGSGATAIGGLLFLIGIVLEGVNQ